MRTVSVRSADLPKVTIPIGYVGENLYTKVIIDCKKDFDEHPDAVVGMSVQPPEGDAYPAVVTRDGDFVIWEVSASDLLYRGSGSIQISFIVDGTIVGKTPAGRTMVNKSIVPNGEAPTPIQNWIDEANAALGTIEGAVQDAEDARDLAQGYADSAYTDAERAEQAAATAGFMDFEINENGRLIYTRTSQVDADFSINGNGHLLIESV